MSSKSLRPVKFTALYYKHLGLKARMLEYEGWMRPGEYLTAREEVSNALKGVGVCDISPFGKIDVKGKDIERFFEKTFYDMLTPRRIGQVKTPNGSPERTKSSSNDDFLGVKVLYNCRLAQDHALIVTSPSLRTISPLDLNGNTEGLISGVYCTNVTSVFAGLNLTGPTTREVMSRLTQVNLSPDDFPNLSCRQGGLAKIHALMIRSDVRYLGETVTSFDLYFSRDYAEYVWDALMDAGKELAIAPLGVTAHNMIHNGSERAADTSIVRT